MHDTRLLSFALQLCVGTFRTGVAAKHSRHSFTPTEYSDGGKTTGGQGGASVHSTSSSGKRGRQSAFGSPRPWHRDRKHSYRSAHKRVNTPLSSPPSHPVPLLPILGFPSRHAQATMVGSKAYDAQSNAIVAPMNANMTFTIIINK